MIRSRFFWRLFLSYTAIVFATVLIVGGWVHGMDASMIPGTAFGLLGALVMGVWVTRRITTPIGQITRVAEAMRRGDYEARVPKLSRDEIGLLGSTFNRLGKEIVKRIHSLTAGEARLRAILSGMIEGVIAVGEEDEILFCNEAAKNIFGYPDLDKPHRKIWAFTELLELRQMIERARKEKKPITNEITLHRREATITLNVAVSSFSSSPHGVIAVFHDISELRRLENIRREFVSNVSHELKTPLTSIKGYVESLQTGALEDPQVSQRFLRKIQTNVDQLTNLVQDLLQLGKIETMGPQSEVEPILWSEILREILPQHELSIESKRLSIREDYQSEEMAVAGERQAMTQIASNLIDNAVKYTPEEGEIQISVQALGRWSTLEVRDTGIGIPENDLGRIFERFYRVDKARSREVGGTGLGLSIVKHLTQGLNGEVSVSSEINRGSRFVVSLPSTCAETPV